MDDQKKLVTRRDVLIASSSIGLTGSLAMLTAVPIPSKKDNFFYRAIAADPEWKKIAEIFGTRGTIEPGEVLLIELPRTDIHATIFNVPIKPELALDTKITFQHLDNGKTIVKYELVLLDSEVNPVLDVLFSQNLQPTTTTLNALHNHFLEVTPHIKYLHGTSIGDPVQIARVLRQALSHTGTPFKQSAAQPGDLGFNAKQIEQTIGGTGMISNGVLSISVERVETIRELGITLQPSMQVETMVSFQSLSDERAAVAGEIIVLPQEADVVARLLRSSGLFVTALHNHELFIEPNLYYLHTFAIGSPIELAKAVRKALNHTHSKFQ